jgi:hypothetical protein
MPIIMKIFESSSMNKEIGAAIGLSANSLRVLSYLGFDVENLRAGDYLGVHVDFSVAARTRFIMTFCRTWFNSNGGDHGGKFDALHDPDNTFGRVGQSKIGFIH